MAPWRTNRCYLEGVSVARKLKTNAELCSEADALPEGQTGEVIDGVLHVMGRPSGFHASVEMALGSQLRFGGGGGGPVGGWLILAEVEVRFANDETCVPDITGWRTEKIGNRYVENPIRVVPDWVCEILSDSTRKKDLGPKRDMYARHGVSHLWIIEPEAHVLEVFTLNPDRKWTLAATFTDDAEVDASPFIGTMLKMAQWWLPKPAP